MDSAKRKSCPTNLLKIVEDWTRSLDEGYGIGTAYLDYRKTFDTISHSKLMVKLQEYGI